MSQESTAKLGPSRRRVFLVRHGNVSYFDDDGRPFRPDIVPLNAEGRAQAASAAQLLARVPFDRVVSSGLPRSDETATIIATHRGLTIETREALREIRPGRLVDIPPDSIEQVFVNAFAGTLDRNSLFLGGESFGSLLDRVLGCWNQLLSEPSWSQMLIVAHGAVNRAILCDILGSGLAGFSKLEQDTGGINIIDADQNGRLLIRLLNHTPYNAIKAGLDLTTMERLFAEYRERIQRRQPSVR